jgi:hypothetical protein
VHRALRIWISLSLPLVLSAIAACGRDDIGVRALPADVAVVHCTPAGRNIMPPVLLRSAAPPPATGLYARRMDPMALDDMGYERDRPVCAGLLPPSAARIEAAEAALVELTTLAHGTGRSVKAALGRCACDVAYRAGMRDVLPQCIAEPTREGCDPEAGEQERFAELMAPLVAAIDRVDLPRVHWRLAGRTDRPTWLPDHIGDLVARHLGGSTVFRPGEAVPDRGNYRLLERLLKLDDVVVVARQDNGTALLVARVKGDAMILDHFSVATPASRFTGLLEAIDNARVDDVIAGLTLPESGAQWVPGRDPTQGAMVELHRDGLVRMDDLVIAQSTLTERRYPRGDETWEEPQILVDHATMQAPFGAEGRALDVDLVLSEAGRTWAAALPDARLSPDASELGLPAETARYEPPPLPGMPTFWLRGTAAADMAIHGLSWAGELMRRVELEYPGSLDGTARAWKLDLPQGSIGFGGALPAVPGAESIADVLAERPMHATATLEADGTRVHIELRPR